MRRTAFFLCASLASSACTPASPSSSAEDLTDSTNTALSEATITFTADWAENVAGVLVEGGVVHLAYDEARLAACRGSEGGKPQYAVTAHVRSADGGVQDVVVAGLNAPSNPSVHLQGVGDIEVWFESTNKWGCHAWDSNLGENYTFHVVEDPQLPDWIGNAASVTSRETCDGGPCDASRQDLAGGFAFDSWTRERAAIASLYFDVWEPGVTDFDNGDLWRQLDAQIHVRWAGQEAFETHYADIVGRVGNDARYGVSLKALDPFRYPLPETDGCTAGTMETTPDGQSARAAVEFYFTVNGKELRPASGATYHGTFDGPLSAYPACLAD